MEKKADSSKFSTFSFYRQKKETELEKLAAPKKSGGIFSYFSKNNEEAIPDIESGELPPTEHTTLMSSIKAGITKRALGVKEMADNTINQGRNLKFFLIFFMIGCFLIFLSLMFLPLAAISPYKFASLFSLGSFCILVGLGYYHGIYKFTSQ